MDISRIIEGVKKDREMELFRKVKYICRTKGEVKKVKNGKIYSEFNFGDGLKLNYECYDSFEMKNPEHICISDSESGAFIPYFRYGRIISCTSFDKVDFSKVPGSIFEKIDELARGDP